LKKFLNIRVIKALSSHHLIILQFCFAIEGYILYQPNGFKIELILT